MSPNFTELLDALDDELRTVTQDATNVIGKLDGIKDQARAIARRAVEAKKNITKSTTGTRKRKPKVDVPAPGVTQTAAE